MEKKSRPERGPRSRWWVVHRHDEHEVLQADTRPPVKNEPGQRAGGVKGPYPTKEAAQAASDKRYARTLKGISERNG